MQENIEGKEAWFFSSAGGSALDATDALGDGGAPLTAAQTQPETQPQPQPQTHALRHQTQNI